MTQHADDEATLIFRSQVATLALPPSRLTARDLLTAGKRARLRRRRRSLAASTGALVLTAGIAVGVGGYLPGRDGGARVDTGASSTSPTAPAGPAAPAPCAVNRLALPPGAVDGAVNTGSPSGRYLAGFMRTKTNPGRPVWWDGDKARTIPGTSTGEAMGVNDSGVVVGGGSGAWAYAGGKLVKLPIPRGYTGAEANAINAGGQVAGVLFGSGDRVAPVIWHSPTANARVNVLKAPSGGAMAFGISDSGIAVGRLNGGDGGLYQWDAHGQGSKLTPPAGTRGGHVVGAQGEWAYGAADPGDEGGTPPAPQMTRRPDGVNVAIDRRVAVVWDLRAGAASVVGNGQVDAVNERGQLVVNRPDGTIVLREPNGSERELPTGRGAGAGATGRALSADGTQVAGSDKDQPMRWSCPA